MSELIKCTHCDKTFKRIADMKRHRTQAHNLSRKLIAFPLEIGQKLVTDEDGNAILGGVYIPENYELVGVSTNKHYMRHQGQNFNIYIAFLLSKEVD